MEFVPRSKEIENFFFNPSSRNTISSRLDLFIIRYFVSAKDNDILTEKINKII